MRDGDIWRCVAAVVFAGMWCAVSCRVVSCRDGEEDRSAVGVCEGPVAVLLLSALRRPACRGVCLGLPVSPALSISFVCSCVNISVSDRPSVRRRRLVFLPRCSNCRPSALGSFCGVLSSYPVVSCPVVSDLSQYCHATLRYVRCVAFRSIRCACECIVFLSWLARSFAVLLVSLNLFSLSPILYIHSEGAGVFASLFTATKYLFSATADPLPRSPSCCRSGDGVVEEA